MSLLYIKYKNIFTKKMYECITNNSQFSLKLNLIYLFNVFYLHVIIVYFTFNILQVSLLYLNTLHITILYM